MCGGVEARDAEKAFKVYFPSPKAAFPVMLEGGELLGWVKWGRRRDEPGYGQVGGWARVDTVQRGGWERWGAVPAYGLVDRFMEKEGEPGQPKRPSHWFDVPTGFALDCLVTGEGDQRRVYVVTSAPPAEYAWIHDRWPLLKQIN